jgi:uncharacterized protein (TIGR00369 family)
VSALVIQTDDFCNIEISYLKITNPSSMTNKHQELLRAMGEGKLPAPPIAELIGFKLIEVGNGRIVMEMNASEKHWNPMKTLHGGVICDITDAAMGTSFYTTLEDNESYTTVDLNIKFLRQVITGKLTASAKVVKRGRRLGYMECEVTNEDGELVAKATSSCLVLNQKSDIE